MTAVAVETAGLGHRYGRRWALRDCSLRLPEGHVIGLVGPNGAGKTTLLHLIVGRLRATAGTLSVLGEPVSRRPQLVARVGFVGQNKPLYRGFTVADMLRFGAHLNPGWDNPAAEQRLRGLGIPLAQRVGALSGGQQAQVALTVALGKRPELLVLDEPIANLDPLARQEFLQILMEEVADAKVTVVLSSHLLADLDRVADYLVLLHSAQARLAGRTDELLDAHKLLIGPADRANAIVAAHDVVQASQVGRQATLVVRTRGPIADPSWTARDLTLEQLVLAYMRSSDAHADSSAAPVVALARSNA